MNANAILMAAASLAISLTTIIVVLAIAYAAHIRGAIRQRLSPIAREWAAGFQGSGPMQEKLVAWARIATTDGVLGLLSVPGDESDSFAGNGLQLVLDGADEAQIRSQLQPILDEELGFDRRAVSRFGLVGIYCLAVGILVPGVAGAMAMSAYKAGESHWALSAFSGILLFIYGVSIFIVDLLVTSKFKKIVRSIGIRRQMVVEALVMISAGQSAEEVQDKLVTLDATA